MRRGIGIAAGLVIVFVVATCGREPSPVGGPGESASVNVDRRGGRVEFGALTLEIPAGALADATTITVRQLEDAPWGTIGAAYDFGPDGLSFAVPARLSIAFAEEDLPPGTNVESLAVRVLEDARWMPLDGGEVDARSGTVSALVSHFSIFGVVADPDADAGAGTRWEANGVVAGSSAEVVARLFVSTEIVTLLVDGQGTTAADLVVSGLPLDAPVYVYLDTVEDERVLGPADGGTLSLHLDLDRPRFVWMQFHHSTTGIGGPNDMCTNAGVDGVRVGNTCTLTHDLVGTVEIGADDQVLDCAGYRIAADPAAVGEGFGIRVVGWHGVEVRNCVVGGPGAGFSIGLGAEFSGWPADGSGLTVSDCTFEDNTTGVRLEQVRAASVRDCAVLRSWMGVEVASKSEAVVFERVRVEPPAVAVNKAVGFSTEGFVGKGGVLYIPQACGFLDGVVEGVGTGVAFGMSREIGVRDTDLTGVDTGLLVRDGATVGADPTAPPEWSHRFWHNNVQATTVGVSSPVGPLEVSWSGHGSFWNHSCPGALFTPGVDSDRADVTDSHAYGAADAWTTGGAPGCGPDGDGDTVPDAEDNCPTVANSLQTNVDGAAEGDACDYTPPPAPVITVPADGSHVAGTELVVRGVSEPGSLVAIYECGGAGCPAATAGDCRQVARALTAGDGAFAIPPYEPFEPGAYVLYAVATDGALLASPSSACNAFTVGLAAPDAPYLVKPLDGEIVSDLPVAVEGYSPPSTRVILKDGGAEIAELTPDGDGRFVFGWNAADGMHVLTALAVTADGTPSASSIPVHFTVNAVSALSPVEGEHGKAWLSAVNDSPDPFAVTVQNSVFQVVLNTLPVSGLGGGSPNHRFEAVLSWEVKDPETGGVVATAETTTELVGGPGSGGAPVVANLTASWDGRNAAGDVVPVDVVYPYDVKVDVVRIYQGHGHGPPCSRDEEEIELSGPSSPACVLDRIAAINVGTVTPTLPNAPVDDICDSVPTAGCPAGMDRDQDGLSTCEETCVYGTNPLLRDTDADGLADGEEVAYWSGRGDGVSWNSDLELLESGPGDGLKNIVDPDSDDDGLLDGVEVQGWTVARNRQTARVFADPARPDSDGDTLGDATEQRGVLSALVQRRVFMDPLLEDGDGDGVADGEEVLFSLDPMDIDTGDIHRPDAPALALMRTIPRPVCRTCVGLLPDPPVIVKEMRSTQTGSGPSDWEIMFFKPFNPRGEFTLFVGSGPPDGSCSPVPPESPDAPEGTHRCDSVVHVMDPGDRFENISVWREPRRPGTAPVSAPATTGFYSTVLDEPGFYLLSFRFVPDGDANRTIRVFGGIGRPESMTTRLPIEAVWAKRQPGIRQYLADVPGGGPVYLLGSHFSPDSAELAGVVWSTAGRSDVWTTPDPSDPGLWRVAAGEFRGGEFAYLLGTPPGGEYVIETTSVGTAGDRFFESLAVSAEWPHRSSPRPTEFGAVEIVYDSDSRTRQYEGWESGLGRGPAVVRRGRRTAIMLDQASSVLFPRIDLVRRSISGSTTERFAGIPMVAEPSNTVHRWRSGGVIQARARQLFRVALPNDLPIGYYDAEVWGVVAGPGGPRVDRVAAKEAAIAVVFDPFALVGEGEPPFTEEDVARYAYDEDEDGEALSGVDPDRTSDRATGVDGKDYYARIPELVPWRVGGELHAFRRGSFLMTGAPGDPVWALAFGATDGVTSPFEAMRRVYRVVNQRLEYSTRGWLRDTDAEAVLNSPAPLSALDAATMAAPDTMSGGADASEQLCGVYAIVGSALGRAMGIPTRSVSSWTAGTTRAVFGWSGWHAWLEARLPAGDLPRQPGSVAPGEIDPADRRDPWYVFDSTDFCNRCEAGSASYLHGEESIDPRQDYMRHSALQLGYDSPVQTWDRVPEAETPADSFPGIEDISAEYADAYDYWLSDGLIGVGVLGWGDVDYYRYQGGPSRMSVVFVGPGTMSAVIRASSGSYPRYDPATERWLSDIESEPGAAEIAFPSYGSWGIAVVHDAPDDDRFHGNAVDYRIQVITDAAP